MDIIKSETRGYFKNEWLKSFHSFSFGDYYNPAAMNFRNLRVINHDFIAPEMGFETHPHRNMEIITYVLKGKVAHKDSMGNKTFISTGEVQVMSAGRGVAHSEFNPLKEELELLQIWITPQENGLDPSYEQKLFPVNDRKNQLGLIISPDGARASLKIHQDVRIYSSVLEKDKEIPYAIPNHRYAWVQVANGSVQINGKTLVKGDSVSASFSDKTVSIMGLSAESDLLVFDLG